MRIERIHIIVAGVMTGLLLFGTAGAADQQPPYAHGDAAKLPNGVIGVSLQVGAQRIGDPAAYATVTAPGWRPRRV